MSENAKLTATRDGRVLRVTITNPARLNAIDYATMAGLGDVIAGAADDPGVRAIVITGEGKAFCTGADLSATAGGVSPEEVMDCASRLVNSVAICARDFPAKWFRSLVPTSTCRNPPASRPPSPLPVRMCW